MSIDDLLSLLRQDSEIKIDNDDDIKHFCESGSALYKTAVGPSPLLQRSIWNDADLSLALREGAEGNKHIDLDHVSMSDHKVAMMYRKFGFEGLEGAIETTGARTAFAIARFVTYLPNNQVSISFASSTSAWLKRVFNHLRTSSRSEKADLEVYGFGPATRKKIGYITRVTDVIPATFEQILPNPNSPYMLYVPEVHILIYGPSIQIVRQGLFKKYAKFLPGRCFAELMSILALINNHPEDQFHLLTSDTDEINETETIVKKFENVKKDMDAVAGYLERHEATTTARYLKKLSA